MIHIGVRHSYVAIPTFEFCEPKRFKIFDGAFEGICDAIIMRQLLHIELLGLFISTMRTVGHHDMGDTDSRRMLFQM